VRAAAETMTITPDANPIVLRRAKTVLFNDGNGLAPAQVWRGAGLVVLVSDDATHHGTLRHISISHKHRYPTWEEIKAVRAAFMPADVDAMMMLPVAADYVNLHPNTFHIWQTPAAWEVQ